MQFEDAQKRSKGELDLTYEKGIQAVWKRNIYWESQRASFSAIRGDLAGRKNTERNGFWHNVFAVRWRGNFDSKPS